MKKKICFIINPISGIGKQHKVEDLVKSFTELQKFEIHFEYTKAPHHATELSRNAASQGFDIVVAVGGDGSVNEVSKGLLGSQTALAILPAGSGNGLAWHLGIPLDLKKALVLLLEGQVVKLDCGEIAGKHFVNVCGIGFDAHVAHLFANYGKRGFLSYVKLVQKAYLNYPEQEFNLQFESQKIERKALLISIANGSQFGNNATISPLSDTNDGYMELCILKKIPWYAALFFALRLFSKRAHRSKYIEIFRVKSMRVVSSCHEIHLDGEPVLEKEALDFKIIPSGIRILVPKRN